MVDTSISVFFPCYNEQDNVAKTTAKAVEVLDGIKADYEIIIVNDGSGDKTGQIADELASSNDRIKVVHHSTNLGYGAALQSGFKAACKDLVFYTDGDGQFDIGEMPALLELIDDCDIVSCFRIKRQDNMVRKINAWCWTRLVNILFGMRIRDIDCAFKIYKREIFDNIEMVSNGALIDSEILARATKKGYKVVQKGVHHYPRTAGEQTGAKIGVILKALKKLFTLKKLFRKSKKK